jgi:hypothetical protein
MRSITVWLHTGAATDGLDRTRWTDKAAMLQAVRAVYGGDCDFDVPDGYISDSEGHTVATFGDDPDGPETVRL